MGIRLLVAARKSRKGDAGEDQRYRRQENKNVRTAEASGHVVIATVHDTVSSQSMPWKRRNLREWFTNPAKVALWDAVLISEVSRISRGDSDAWFDIETWCRANGKLIMDAGGDMWPSADDETWDAKRRAAREYWESVRDTHAEVRADIMAAGAALGRPPFGYATKTRDDGYKQFVPGAHAKIAVEIFTRIVNGERSSQVAHWLNSLDLRKRDGKPYFKNGVRVKFVIDTVKRASYLGQRDGHAYDMLPGLTRELWEQANGVLDARYVPHHTGGRIAESSFSGCVYCARCGAPFYRHQSTRNGKPAGREKYLCSRGRVGASAESKCGMPPLVAETVNSQLDTAMRELTHLSESIPMAKGGSYAKQAEIKQLKAQLVTAQQQDDMQQVIKLANLVKVVQDKPDAPMEVSYKFGKAYSELWTEANHGERRHLLAHGGLRMVADGTSVHIDYNAAATDDDETAEYSNVD